MEYRNLGRSGLKMSTVGIGSWLTFGSAVEEAATRACVRAAVEAGVNFIDTADVYARGEAEKVLGPVLAEHRRSDLVIATKLFWPMSENANDRGLSRKHIMESVEGSLRRLRTDYIDLYQCHRPDPETPVEETVRAMSDLVRAGKILYWGTSVWSAGQIMEAVGAARAWLGYQPISNQPSYSLLNRAIEHEILPVCEREGIGQVVFSPLAQGILTGKYADGKVPSGSRLADEKRNTFVKPLATRENHERVRRLAALAREIDATPAQVALAWCLRRSSIASVIVGVTKPEQVAENVRAAALELPEPLVVRLEEIFPLPAPMPML
jgi:voltage-dependent potassium channel beta subunit